MKAIMRMAASGLAFGAVASTGAQAADLQAGVEPVDYVRVCDTFGTGFFYIPGTETCLRISGMARAEYRFNDFGKKPNSWNRTGDGTSTRARGALRLDARTNSEYGLVRAYVDMFMQRDSSGASFELDEAYIQFGNFTFGRAQSRWDFWLGYTFGNVQSQYTFYKNWMAAYTADLGNGVSATVSLEDGTTRRWSLAGGGGAYGGHIYPDLVTNLRIDQGWGSAQVMGALHDIRHAQAGAKAGLGWAIGGGIELKLPALGNGDLFAIQAAYADGAVGYALDTWSGLVTDAVYSGTVSHTTKAWSIGAGLLHNFSETLEGSIEGGYASADAFGTNGDFTQWGANLGLIWKPIAGLGIGGEFAYRNFDFHRSTGVTDTDEMAVTFRVERTF